MGEPWLKEIYNYPWDWEGGFDIPDDAELIDGVIPKDVLLPQPQILDLCYPFGTALPMLPIQPRPEISVPEGHQDADFAKAERDSRGSAWFELRSVARFGGGRSAIWSASFAWLYHLPVIANCDGVLKIMFGAWTDSLLSYVDRAWWAQIGWSVGVELRQSATLLHSTGPWLLEKIERANPYEWYGSLNRPTFRSWRALFDVHKDQVPDSVVIRAVARTAIGPGNSYPEGTGEPRDFDPASDSHFVAAGSFAYGRFHDYSNNEDGGGQIGEGVDAVFRPV